MVRVTFVWIGVAVAFLTCCLIQPAVAMTTVLTFDDLAQTRVTGNLEYGGFRFSPCRQYAIYPGSFDGGVNATNSLQIGGALSAPLNPDFIGNTYGVGDCSQENSLIVDNFGKPFAVQSLFGWLESGCAHRIESSKGGSVDPFSCTTEPAAALSPRLIDLDGPEWVGVQWLRISHGCCFGFGFGDFGFDNLSLSAGVPEPGTFALFGLALAGMRLGRRR